MYSIIIQYFIRDNSKNTIFNLLSLCKVKKRELIKKKEKKMKNDINQETVNNYYIEQLNKYYRRKGIHAENPNWDSLLQYLEGNIKWCKENDEDSKSPEWMIPKIKEEDLLRVKSSGVGKNYGKSKIKLVVISSDPSEVKNLNPKEAYTPKGTIINGYNWREDHKGEHWYRTLIFVAKILQELDDIPINNDSITYFSHVNSTKFKFKDADKKEGPWHLWDFCKRENYLEDEIEILQPNIVWTQGDRARDSFKEAFPKKHILCKKEFYNINQREINGKRILWICTKHPTNKHGDYPAKDGIFKHADDIISILKNNLSKN